MPDQTKIATGFFNLAKYGASGIIIALICYMGVDKYLDYKESSNHIEHWTQAVNKFDQSYQENNEIQREHIKVLTEIQTIIRER